MDNKTAHHLVSIFTKLKCIPVGSYGRNSHEPHYKDLDFVTSESLAKIRILVDKLFTNVKIVRNGKKYLSLLINHKYKVDIWKTNDDDFYKTYMTRILPKKKLIYINKVLKK